MGTSSWLPPVRNRLFEYRDGYGYSEEKRTLSDGLYGCSSNSAAFQYALEHVNTFGFVFFNERKQPATERPIDCVGPSGCVEPGPYLETFPPLHGVLELYDVTIRGTPKKPKED
jgi:hypothetical protein